MNLFFRVGSLLIFCFGNFLNANEPIRTWTSSDGRTLEASFIEKVEGNIKIRTSQGREFTLPITRFSKADQEYVVEAAARSLFRMPKPFEERGKGAIIIASATGKVTVIPAPRYSDSGEVKPVARDVIIGEPLPHGSTIITEVNSEADLLLTTGSLAKVGPNSKLLLSAFWQRDFRASAKKVTDLKQETSSSRVAFKLETGDLVVDVKKLNRESSFIIESPLAAAGIRGTQFGLSADSDSTQLAVLEGSVGFLDSNQKAKSVKTSQKIAGTEDGSGKIDALPESEKAELAKAVAESQESASEYDLTRLANTVDGYAPKPNYIVKSALNMELIWCPPGSFIMGPGSAGNWGISPSFNVVLTKGFYLGKYEVKQEEYLKVTRTNPSKLKSGKYPVENITWDEAIDFCKILNNRERLPRGLSFRLPTEAEWEYACRAGTSTIHYWGTTENLGFSNSKSEKITTVGSFIENQWGFHDMEGNVWEWCNDRYAKYPRGIVFNPYGPEVGDRRIVRGGGANNDQLGSTHRDLPDPTSRSDYRGFRLCLAPAR
jgi:formylglycine-generating enzyme required for sulfatase activity